MTNRIDIGAELWVMDRGGNSLLAIFLTKDNTCIGYVKAPNKFFHNDTLLSSTQLRAIADFMDTLKKEQA